MWGGDNIKLVGKKIMWGRGEGEKEGKGKKEGGGKMEEGREKGRLDFIPYQLETYLLSSYSS